MKKKHTLRRSVAAPSPRAPRLRRTGGEVHDSSLINIRPRRSVAAPSRAARQYVLLL